MSLCRVPPTAWQRVSLYTGEQFVTEPLVEIGRITRGHGLKGEVRVESFVESPAVFSGTIWLADGANPVFPKKVIGVKAHQGHVLLRLEGVNDRTAADGLRGLAVLAAAAILPELPDGGIYLHELIGLAVLDAATDAPIGTLERVDAHAGQETWVIRTAEGKEILFPAVEEFVGGIDLEAGAVRVLPPPGLLELYI